MFRLTTRLLEKTVFRAARNRSWTQGRSAPAAVGRPGTCIPDCTALNSAATRNQAFSLHQRQTAPESRRSRPGRGTHDCAVRLRVVLHQDGASTTLRIIITSQNKDECRACQGRSHNRSCTQVAREVVFYAANRGCARRRAAQAPRAGAIPERAFMRQCQLMPLTDAQQGLNRRLGYNFSCLNAPNL